jgi:hypothetical protein
VTNLNLNPNSKPVRRKVGLGILLIMLVLSVVFISIGAFIISSASEVWLGYMFLIPGIVLPAVATFAFINSLRRSKAISHLIKNGQKLESKLLYIKYLGRPMNASHYEATIVAKGASGGEQKYTSDKIEYLSGAANSLDFSNLTIPIDVYVNPTNVKDYYVDITQIPDLHIDKIDDLVERGAAVDWPKKR